MSIRLLKYTPLAIYAGVLSLVLLSHPTAASDLYTQDIILSANGAAGFNEWEYNAAQKEGWVQHTIYWQPPGISKVTWRCVDNCKDEYKFEYRIKLDNGQMKLIMRATTGEQGLIRVQLTSLID